MENQFSLLSKKPIPATLFFTDQTSVNNSVVFDKPFALAPTWLGTCATVNNGFNNKIKHIITFIAFIVTND